MLQEYWASTVIFIGIFSQCTQNSINFTVSYYDWSETYSGIFEMTEDGCKFRFRKSDIARGLIPDVLIEFT